MTVTVAAHTVLDPDVREAVRAVLGRVEVPGAAPDPQLDRQTWDRLSAGGFTGLGLPEAHGGSGGTLRDLAAVVYEAAYACASTPVVETAWLAAPWLALLGETSGPRTATASVAPAVRLDDAGRLTGKVTSVPALRWAELVVLHVPTDNGARVALVEMDHPGSSVATGANLAGEPRDTLTLDGVPARSVAVEHDEARSWRQRGALARSVQLAAVAQRVQDRTVAFARQREQFGRPVAAFQAVQHRLTGLAGDVAVMGAAADAAVAATADGSAEAGFLVAVAKAETSSRAGRVAAAGHQLHGAIGFTLEHDLGAATKRLWAWREEFGGEGEWRVEVAEAADRDVWERVTR